MEIKEKEHIFELINFYLQNQINHIITKLIELRTEGINGHFIKLFYRFFCCPDLNLNHPDLVKLRLLLMN